jgi:uncharacterized membrane protein
MLDAWFMNKLNSQGKKWYWIGQLGFMVVLAVLVFGTLGMDLDKGVACLAGGVVVFILAWGFTCKAF